MSHKYFKKAIFTVLSVAFICSSSFAQDGEKIFNANCKSCHNPGEKKVVGPGLKGYAERWKDKALLYKWVRNSQEVIKSGDAYANELYNKYNKTQMTAFPSLSDKDIDAIFAYVDAYKPPVETATAAGTDGGAANASKSDSDTVVYILLGIGLIFFIIINALTGVKRSLTKLVAEKDGEELPAGFEHRGWDKIKWWMGANKKWVAVIILVLVAYGAKVGWDTLWNIGVYEGYMPEQPIKFSHKLHAGKNAVNCVYCHGSAERGKAAGVPSANVCMNCHKYIQEGPVYGKTEISKIYAALDYNPETQQYGKNPKPVKWVKVHVLPDHVYFNHSQHVVVGKVECQTCHGPVQEMDTVRQHSPLTMGWCIDCHRKTEVKMEGNAYYTELHSKLKEKYKGQKLTVSKIGGLECSRCHY